MVFTSFKLLPYEIRAQIWRISCQNARMAVMSLEPDSLYPTSDKSPLVCRMMQQTGCSSVAMVCKEAFSEWEKTTILFSESPCVRLCVSKTIFLLPNLAELGPMSLRRQLVRRGIASGIQHIAFFVTGKVKLMDVLSALSNLPSVKTIYLLLAECHAGGLEVGSLCGMAQIARYLDALTEDPSTKSVHASSNPIGLYLETGTLNSRVEAFYTGANAPQLKVVIPPCARHCRRESTCVLPSTGFSLFEYV
ncbi:hypothetical protein IWW34DRAFT_890585 [Fusarium oxysporum f. sp. albedinis]|nr:hypothetical protein IWW34DRAFT_890585 [Fusarium oxysporum f. sp. albedinis]